MRKHHKETGPASDPMTKLAVDLAAAIGERSHLNKELVIALAQAVGVNERTQHRFRTAVLVSLSKIEAMLTEIQGAQLVQFWPPGSIPEEKRDGYVREVQERVTKASNEIGLKMVEYIYGQPEQPSAPRDKRRKWSDWEI